MRCDRWNSEHSTYDMGLSGGYLHEPSMYAVGTETQLVVERVRLTRTMCRTTRAFTDDVVQHLLAMICFKRTTKYTRKKCQGRLQLVGEEGSGAARSPDFEFEARTTRAETRRERRGTCKSKHLREATRGAIRYCKSTGSCVYSNPNEKLALLSLQVENIVLAHLHCKNDRLINR